MIHIIIIILVALLFSAFFSGMEIAFVASNKLKLEIDKKQNRTLDYIISVFTHKPGQYITTILVGNNIALVVYSLFMSALIQLVCAHMGWTLFNGSVIFETIVSTVVIIFAGEFIPKAAVRTNPNFYIKAFAVPVYFFYIILYPVARFTTWLSGRFLKLFRYDIRDRKDIITFDKVDLEHLVDQAEESGAETDNENEWKLFRKAMDFSDLMVRNCMVPRVEIEAVDRACSIEELSKTFIDTQYSRILVYDGNIDNVVGYVNSKSLFAEPSAINDVIMDILHVPETLPVQKLLEDFIRSNSAIAVVIDEFGGTAGLVTLEDVLEEIFGEIEDEYDTSDLIEKQLNAAEFVLSGRLEVEYLNDKYGLGIPESDEYDTLAGFVIFSHEGLPKKGDVIECGSMEVRVLKVSGSKLELMKVKIED